MSSVEGTRTQFSKINKWHEHQKGKINGIFFLITKYIFRFQDFVYIKLCLRMILNYVIKYITQLFDIPFCFMQYECTNFHKLVSH